MKIILLIVNILLALTAIAYPIIWLFFQADQLLHTLPYVMSLLWLIKSLIQPNKGQRIFALSMAALLFLVGWQRSLDMMYWYPIFNEWNYVWCYLAESIPISIYWLKD